MGLVVLIVAIYAFMQYRNGVREDALREALKVQDAQVGAGAPPSEAVMTFPTQPDKDKAVVKAMTDVADKYAGSDQGEIARYFLATNATDKGDLATAEKAFKQVAENGSKNYASLAKLSLASIYKSQGKLADGEKLLRDVMANPTMFVSKEQATIALGRYLGGVRSGRSPQTDGAAAHRAWGNQPGCAQRYLGNPAEVSNPRCSPVSDSP